MVVENPVTSVLYNQFPFERPYCMLNRFVPEYGPQPIKMLVGLTLLDSVMIGITIWGFRAGQSGENTPLEPPELEDEELEDELEVGDVAGVGVGVGVAVGVGVGVTHVDLATVVLFNVTAPVLSTVLPAKSLPSTVELPLSVIDVYARMFPTNEVLVPRVTELPTCQKTLQD